MPEVSYREASKIQVLEAPRLAPGVCAICGSASTDDRQYIDIGWTIEFVGVVYFCTFCFSEAVNVLGCLTKEQTEALEAENNRLRQRIIDFTAKEMAIQDVAAKLRDTGLLDLVVDKSNSNADPSSGEESSKVDEYYRQLQQSLDANNRTPEQITTEQRSDGVSDSDPIKQFGEF